MKNLFSQFDQISENEKKEVWKKAIFIFDANVLLGMYRYEPIARKEMLEALQKLGGRIWVPHQVALEFQRNRVNVIAEQLKTFIRLRAAIGDARKGLDNSISNLRLKKKNSLINVEPFSKKFEEISNKFIAELNELEKQQQKLNEPDELKDRIEELFSNRVGQPPASQDVLKELYGIAEIRYQKSIPPGYKDADKAKGNFTEHSHEGIVYETQYGDYLLWHQILEHVENSGEKNVVFVTDDAKEDWWLYADVGGDQNLGARPELIDEIKTKAKVERFLMHSTEGFLLNAKAFLDAEVSDATLEEVSQVIQITSEQIASEVNPDPSYTNDFEAALLLRIQSWLTHKYGFVIQSTSNPFNFLGQEADGFVRYEVHYGGLPPLTPEFFIPMLIDARAKNLAQGHKSVTIILIVKDVFHAAEVMNVMQKIEKIPTLGDINIMTVSFRLRPDSENRAGLRIHDEFTYKRGAAK